MLSRVVIFAVDWMIDSPLESKVPRMITKTRLQMDALQKRLDLHREGGALVYITRTSQDGGPLNFKITGSMATTGNWSRGLTSRTLTWILIYQSIGNNRGRVWVGDHVRTTSQNGRYVFHLKNVAGPLDVAQSVQRLIGKRPPQQPIFLTTRLPGTRSMRSSQSDQDLSEDLVELVNGDNSPAARTDAYQLILARLGQGKFRSDVLTLWNGACAVTGCKVVDALRASHIRPWRNSDHRQRRDPENGLPLTASLDALFDRGLITFSDAGDMLVSEMIDGADRALFGIPTRLRRRPSPKQKEFLSYHRECVFRP